jgi:rhamnosyltransferase
MSSHPSISIVLLCKDGADTLRAVLDGLFAQEISMPYEVIVIDSGSTDGSLEISRAFPLRLIEIPPSEFNYGSTKNFSLRHAGGEFVVFVSQDAIPADTAWLRELVEPMTGDPGIAAVYSRQLEHEPCNLFERFMLRTAYGEKPILWDDYDACAGMSFSNASSALRRSLLEEVPFLKVPFAEDRVWAVEMIRRGGSILYNPASRVIHSHDLSVRQFYSRSLKNAITKRLVDNYRASPRPLLTRFLNPLGAIRLLRRYRSQGESVGLREIGELRRLLPFYPFAFAEFLGNLIGSRLSYRDYR